MSALRILVFCYLAVAAAFVAAIAMADQAHLRQATAEATQALSWQLESRVIAPALAFARAADEKFLDPAPPRVALALAAPGPNDARSLAHAIVPPVAPHRLIDAPPPPPTDVPVTDLPTQEPLIIAPDLDDDAAPAPPQPERQAQNNLPPRQDDFDGVEQAAVAARLRRSLSPELLKNFGLFLYVSKAAHGPVAQRLYVFRKSDFGALELAYDWAASTGREQYEVTPKGRRSFTGTPNGLYELDPTRMFRRYHSQAWDQPMPYAMFFNWEHDGLQSGLAIHAATGGDIARLGARASAGCVHISPEHAELLYKLIRSDYRGKVPRFAYDRRTQTMSNKGELMHDAQGRLQMTDGYRVLINIENFGGEDLLAALY